MALNSAFGLLAFASLPVTWVDHAALAPRSQPAQAAADIHLAVAYPRQFAANTDKTVALVLSRTPEGMLVPVVATPDSNMVRLFPTPGPVGTLGARIEDAHGPDYAVYASASLSAPGFSRVDRSLPQQQEQLLRAGQEPIEWKWTLAGGTAGEHTLQFNLELHFKPRGSASVLGFDQRVWDKSVPITIEPVNPLSPGELGPNVIKASVPILVSSLLQWAWRKFRGLFISKRSKGRRPRRKR
jgi:hypothetical protein